MGIPIILAGIILAVLTFWRIGLALFVGGWILLLAGHRIEANKPAFFQGLIYFLVGPIWVAKESKNAIFGASERTTTVRSIASVTMQAIAGIRNSRAEFPLATARRQYR